MSGDSFGARADDSRVCADDADVDAAFVARLAAVDASALDDHDLLEHIAATERAASWFASVQLSAVAELARRPARVAMPGEDPAAARAAHAPSGRCVREFVAEEIAARLKVSGAAAGNRVRLGCALVGLPATAAALHRGRIDVARARVLVEETAALDRAAAREVDAALAGVAADCSAARLRPRVRRAVLAVDPAAARRREVRARSERRVAITPAADGMAELWALLPAASARAVDAALTASARSARAAGGSEERSRDQLRADALVAPFLAAADGSAVPGGTGGRGAGVEVQVIVAASTLRGRDDQPALLAGYGPITAESARDLASGARWRRILTDPVSGAVLDVGRSTYRPPSDLERYVRVRDQRCSFPGCGWPAVSCDLDHAVAFPAGATSAANLGARCRRHHRFKHTDSVTVTQGADGTSVWVLPTGHRYVVAPGSLDLPRDTTVDPPSAEPLPTERTSTDQSDGEGPPDRRRPPGREPPF